MNKLKWIGLLNINEDIKRELENLKIFIGGDVRYGYGLMKIIKIENKVLNKNPVQKNYKEILIKDKWLKQKLKAGKSTFSFTEKWKTTDFVLDNFDIISDNEKIYFFWFKSAI